tara:strand:- start:950 stop:1858 length:909 start_codon:yes stop_codon:yes gene_type:complete
MLNTAGYKNNGLHVFVFCCADYKDIVKDCISSIEQYVLDPIASYNIVSNTEINIHGYNLVKDRDFWSLINPDLKYQNLYNHNWIKQQIFKLNLDRIVSGNILIVDAEVRFQKPTRWLHDDRYTVFYTNRWKKFDINSTNYDSTEFVRQTLNLEVDSTKNFIVEATVFSTDILKEMRTQIENIHGVDQLAAYQQIVFDDPTSLHPSLKLFMSEYDMYINYLITMHPEKVNDLINLATDKSFLSFRQTTTSNSINNQTKWITFYEQIKDSSWPDCYCEEDFYKLPEHIQEECINIFGYNPTINE